MREISVINPAVNPRIVYIPYSGSRSANGDGGRTYRAVAFSCEPVYRAFAGDCKIDIICIIRSVLCEINDKALFACFVCHALAGDYLPVAVGYIADIFIVYP